MKIEDREVTSRSFPGGHIVSAKREATIFHPADVTAPTARWTVVTGARQIKRATYLGALRAAIRYATSEETTDSNQ